VFGLYSLLIGSYFLNVVVVSLIMAPSNTINYFWPHQPQSSAYFSGCRFYVKVKSL